MSRNCHILDRTENPGRFSNDSTPRNLSNLLDELVKKTEAVIDQRGNPVCILGVNSSPTCGVTSTYYGSEGSSPPKRNGRGVFLKRFPEIVAMDVTTFSRYRVYLAAPLFSEAERSYNRSIEELLRKNFFDVYLPQQAGDDSEIREKEEQRLIFSKNLKALENADIIVAIIDGADADSGTAWEMGYAFARGKKVIGLRTDFRRSGNHEKVNFMLEESAIVVTNTNQLLDEIKSPLKVKTDS